MPCHGTDALTQHKALGYPKRPFNSPLEQSYPSTRRLANPLRRFPQLKPAWKTRSRTRHSRLVDWSKHQSTDSFNLGETSRLTVPASRLPNSRVDHQSTDWHTSRLILVHSSCTMLLGTINRLVRATSRLILATSRLILAISRLICCTAPVQPLFPWLRRLF